MGEAHLLFLTKYSVYIWLTVLFLFGTAVGSFLNVCIARLPLEKSILWPGSRCGHCLQPISRWDNLPLIGYLRLRGRCRTCGTTFSSRYLWVELFTGLAWAGLFYVEIVSGWNTAPYFREQAWQISAGAIPFDAWVYFFHHGVLLSFLIVAAGADLDYRWIPPTVTLPGTVLGLLSATLHPWPWPNDPGTVARLAALPSWASLDQPPVTIPLGLYPWPFWGPPPAELPAGSWQLGLVTGVVGALVGTFLLRGIKFLAEQGLGKEALGVGDADLMMMAGAFLGWQPVVIAFFVGAMAALVLAVGAMVLVRRTESAIPFGPGLAVGIVITWLCWHKIGPAVQDFLFSDVVVAFLVLIVGVGMFLLTLLIRVLSPGREG